MLRLILPLSLAAGAAAAAPLSAPDPLPLPPALPAPKDLDYPGTIRLTVDATDVARGIFRVREVIPVAEPGHMTLLYPQWLPGNHSPRGPVDDAVGFRFAADGRPVAWTRDPVNVYALHLDLPADAREVTAEFQYVSPTKGEHGRVVVTPDMLSLQWNLTALYPAGWFTRRIPVAATAVLPAGWRYAAALDPVDTAAAGTVAFKPVDFETLVDSPMLAGRYFRAETLAPGVRLDMFADAPEELAAASPEQIARHRAVVEQTTALFGSQHYDRYDFLVAVSDKLGDIGLEHHRSTEITVAADYFTDWAALPQERNVIPHEFVHSWNGKYRRPADLFTPDFSTPMRNSLLWVYEGQTQFWGYVLQARAGLVSKDETLGALATIAASLDTRPGRGWRPLEDTTFDPILAYHAPQPWVSWQRQSDYYNEGLLVWLEADMKLRALTAGRKSLDDFARAFFGPGDRDWGTSTYTFGDVVRGLNGVAPYDWAGFLRDRVDAVQPRAPLAGIVAGGYRLAYAAEPTAYWSAVEKARKIIDLSYSLGVTLNRDGEATSVIWDGPAFAAAITVGTRVVAVAGRAYDADVLKAAIRQAASDHRPIELLIRKGDRYSTVSIPYAGGLRYPRLEKAGSGEGWLDRLLAPRR